MTLDERWDRFEVCIVDWVICSQYMWILCVFNLQCILQALELYLQSAQEQREHDRGITFSVACKHMQKY